MLKTIKSVIRAAKSEAHDKGYELDHQKVLKILKSEVLRAFILGEAGPHNIPLALPESEKEHRKATTLSKICDVCRTAIVQMRPGDDWHCSAAVATRALPKASSVMYSA